MQKVWLVIAVVLGCLVPGQPAHAYDAIGTVRTSDGLLLQDGCGDYPVNYELHLPSGTSEWMANLEIIEPKGGHAIGGGHAGAYLSSLGGDPAVGTVDVFLCPRGRLDGRYGVTFEGSFKNAITGDGRITGNGSFRLRKAKTTAQFRVSTRAPRFNEVVRFDAFVRIQSSDGYRPLEFEKVHVQVKDVVGRRWVNLKAGLGVLYTGGNGKGHENITWNIHKTFTFRLKVDAGLGYLSSASSSITINPRG